MTLLIKRKDITGHGAQLKIEGLNPRPVLSEEFIGLPSTNTHYAKHFRPRSVATAEWRYEAKHKALETTLWMDTPFLVNRALVVVNFFPPYEEISDVHNVYIKALLDGFTDAGVWRDDEWAFLPLVLFAWAGIGQQRKGSIKERKTRLDVYELESYWIGGERQTLPRGRRWLHEQGQLAGPVKIVGPRVKSKSKNR